MRKMARKEMPVILTALGIVVASYFLLIAVMTYVEGHPWMQYKGPKTTLATDVSDPAVKAELESYGFQVEKDSMEYLLKISGVSQELMGVANVTIERPAATPAIRLGCG
jgi:hypothetical protein